MWVNAIVRIIRELRKIIVNKKQHPEKKKYDLVIAQMGMLNIILNADHLRDVFTESSLCSQIVPTVESESMSNEDVEDLEDTPEDATTKARGDFVFRYLQTLTSWTQAVSYLFRPKFLKRFGSLEATLIRLPDHYDDRRSVLKLLRDAIIVAAESPSGDAAVQWLNNRFATAMKQGCHVHAEAGIMALVSDVHAFGNDHGDRIANAIKHLNSVFPVGVSKKCCWTCSRLGLLMFPSESGHSGQLLQLQLPDTHATVYPWDPPGFGIPREVLIMLRDELKRHIIECALRDAILVKDVSRQSSPTSDSDGEDDKSERLVMRNNEHYSKIFKAAFGSQV